MKILTVGFCLPAVFLASSLIGLSEASAAKNCKGYAQAAVSQNRINLKKKCGYSGFAWHANFGVHQGWCLFARSSKVTSATRTRQKDIDACLAKKGGVLGKPKSGNRPKTLNAGMSKSGCEAYARQARKLIDDRDTKCGEPATFIDNYSGELGYCLNTPRKKRQSIMNHRIRGYKRQLKNKMCV